MHGQSDRLIFRHGTDDQQGKALSTDHFSIRKEMLAILDGSKCDSPSIPLYFIDAELWQCCAAIRCKNTWWQQQASGIELHWLTGLFACLLALGFLDIYPKTYLGPVLEYVTAIPDGWPTRKALGLELPKALSAGPLIRGVQCLLNCLQAEDLDGGTCTVWDLGGWHTFGWQDLLKSAHTASSGPKPSGPGGRMQNTANYETSMQAFEIDSLLIADRTNLVGKMSQGNSATNPNICWGKSHVVLSWTWCTFQASFKEATTGASSDREVQATPSYCTTWRVSPTFKHLTKVQWECTRKKIQRGESEGMKVRRPQSAKSKSTPLQTTLTCSLDKGAWTHCSIALAKSKTNRAESPKHCRSTCAQPVAAIGIWVSLMLKGSVGGIPSMLLGRCSACLWSRAWRRALASKGGRPRDISKSSRQPQGSPKNRLVAWADNGQNTTDGGLHFEPWKPEGKPRMNSAFSSSKKTTRIWWGVNSNLAKFQPQSSQVTAWMVVWGTLSQAWRCASIVHGHNSTTASAKEGSQHVRWGKPNPDQVTRRSERTAWSKCQSPVPHHESEKRSPRRRTKGWTKTSQAHGEFQSPLPQGLLDGDSTPWLDKVHGINLKTIRVHQFQIFMDVQTPEHCMITKAGRKQMQTPCYQGIPLSQGRDNPGHVQEMTCEKAHTDALARKPMAAARHLHNTPESAGAWKSSLQLGWGLALFAWYGKWCQSKHLEILPSKMQLPKWERAMSNPVGAKSRSKNQPRYGVESCLLMLIPSAREDGWNSKVHG